MGNATASLRAVDLAVDGNVAAKLQQRIHAFEEEARDYEERLHSLSKSTLELESMLVRIFFQHCRSWYG